MQAHLQIQKWENEDLCASLLRSNTYALLIWWNPVFPTILSHTFWFQGSDSELSQSDLTALITHFVKTMVTFAKSVAGFSDLAPEQQVQVCSRSASQFIQFLLARCLGSKDPTEQLQWLLDIQRPQTSTGNQEYQYEYPRFLDVVRWWCLDMKIVRKEEKIVTQNNIESEQYWIFWVLITNFWVT